MCVVGPKQMHVPSGHEQLTWYCVVPQVSVDVLWHWLPSVAPPPPLRVHANDASGAVVSPESTDAAGELISTGADAAHSANTSLAEKPFLSVGQEGQPVKATT
jgi:hypothetical protein